MSSITDENGFDQAVDHMSKELHDEFLHDIDEQMGNEANDILDEFLDHRVYKTNENGGMNFKADSGNLLDFYHNEPYGNLLNQASGDKDNDYMFYGSHGNGDNGEIYCSPTASIYNADGLREKHDSTRGSVDMAPSLEERESLPFTDNQLQMAQFERVREEFAKLKFGNSNMSPCPSNSNITDPSYLDMSPEALRSLPYSLTVSKLPTCLRVETQIKINISISPPPPQLLLHIPQDLVSKSKFCLDQDIEHLPTVLKENLLYLDAYVLTSDLKTCCNICSRCIKREQKRASRRKAGMHDDNDNSNGKSNLNAWSDENMIKKALIFNCKEIISFPPPSGLSNDFSKSLDLSARIICYCRHHKENEGFNLLFVLKNYKGNVVARTLSSTIMIMDRKKTTSASKTKIPLQNSLPNSLSNSTTNLMQHSKMHSALLTPKTNEFLETQPVLSPHSMDESNSDLPININNVGESDRKRKKLSVDESSNNQTNPMYNGSTGFSPLSNSDTNTSATNMYIKSSSQAMDGGIAQVSRTSSFLHSPLEQNKAHSIQARIPSIQKIIPAQGPIRGGIEVTLLGNNFHHGLAVKFGANQALATHCWSDTTIVTYLPPAAQAGQVLVSFDNIDLKTMAAAQQHLQLQIFTYTDDTDRQLIELALQLVGFKMNGKLEDAKNIARRIVGTESPTSSMNNNESPTSVDNNMMHKANSEWMHCTSKAIKALTRSRSSTEELLIKFLSSVDLPNCPIIIPNWQLCNSEGQTLLHLATLKNYGTLVKFLVVHGCKIDIQDNQGITPLFLASTCGNRDLIKLFINCKSNWNMKLSNEKTLQDYCDPNVLDMFKHLYDSLESSDDTDSPYLKLNDDVLSKSKSVDSLSSLISLKIRQHVPRMVLEDMVKDDDLMNGEAFNLKALNATNDEPEDSEFADSELDSNDYCEGEYDDECSSQATPDFHLLVCSEESTDLSENNRVRGTRTSDGNGASQQGGSSIPSDEDNSNGGASGLWEKVKKVFNTEEDNQLPSYDDLFPFGPSSSNSKPKSYVERELNHSEPGASISERNNSEQPDDGDVPSDFSDDVVLHYINKSRKTVQNDTMLLFFWVPALVLLLAFFFFVSIMGYNFEFVDAIKHHIRLTIGKMMIGRERISKVFKLNNGNTMDKMIDATIHKFTN